MCTRLAGAAGVWGAHQPVAAATGHSRCQHERVPGESQGLRWYLPSQVPGWGGHSAGPGQGDDLLCSSSTSQTCCLCGSNPGHFEG